MSSSSRARALAAVASIATALIAVEASAQDCDADAGAHVVPRMCLLDRAAVAIDRAVGRAATVCRATGPMSGDARAARDLACGAAPPGPLRCDAASLDALDAWSRDWTEAGRAVLDAWGGHPLPHAGALEVASAARRVRAATRAACRATAAPLRDVAAQDAYAARVAGVRSRAELCASFDEILGRSWSGATSRWAYAPLRKAVAPLCPDVREPETRWFARSTRGRDITRAILGMMSELEGPLVIFSMRASDQRLITPACAQLPLSIGAGAASRIANVCPGVAAPPFVSREVAGTPVCSGEDAPARARCDLDLAIRHGAYSRATWTALAERAPYEALRIVASHLRDAARAAVHTDAAIAPADLALTAASVGGERCARLSRRSEAILGASPSTLDETGSRVLLASARCRAGQSLDERRRAANELERIREAAIQSPAFRRSPDATAIVATAGLLLLSTPGYQAAGRELVRPLLDDPSPFETTARVVSAGAPVDAAARRAASMIASRALGRLAEIAIDERSYDVARDAIRAMEAVSETSAVDAREREIQRVDRALLRVAAALSRGDGSAARSAVGEARDALDARTRRTGGDRRLEHEVLAREIEVGLVEAPAAPENACAEDFVRRGLVRAAVRARSPDERAALVARLGEILAREPLTRGPCLRARGFRRAEVLAALARVDLLVACVDEGDPGCTRDAEGTARAIGDSLLAGVAAFERAVDDLLVEGDVDRTRSLVELSERFRGAAARATDEEHLRALRTAGASSGALDRLAWIAYSTPSCLAYPDLRVHLKYLAGRDVPRCTPLERADDTAGATLAYVRYDDARRGARYAAWRRDRRSLERIDLGTARSVERAIEEAVRALSDPSAPFEAFARDLHDLVLARALRGLPREARLTIVPDAALASVPFDVLLALAGRDDVRVRYALDVTPLADEPRAPAGTPAVVVADPRFGPSDGARGLTRLHGTRAEAEIVCDHYRCDARRLERGAATEPALFGAVQERLGRYGVVHLATHAVFTGTDAVASRAAVLLAGVGDDLPETPLFSSNEDGMLEERELAALGLPYTDVVVLSACGTTRGESRLGVRGLARAARLSGARSIAGSLWSVDDDATSALMRAFYARLASGDGAATALRTAARSVREQRPHPYYWAPFVLLEARP